MYKNFGEFEEIGLPKSSNFKSNVLTVIPQEMLTGLTTNQQDQAIKLFEKYKKVFANDDWDLGKAKNVIHQIDSQGSPPIFSWPIRHSQANQQVANEEIDNFLSPGLMIPSYSPWSSPLLVIKKKDGPNRVVIDYQKLNAVTKKIAIPYPKLMIP